MTSQLKQSSFLYWLFLVYENPITQQFYTLYFDCFVRNFYGDSKRHYRHLNIPGIVTTFLTGTITSIGMSMVKGVKSGFKKEVKEKISRIANAQNVRTENEIAGRCFLSYAVTAVLTGWMEFHSSHFLPLLPLLLILVCYNCDKQAGTSTYLNDLSEITTNNLPPESSQ